jgi:hypothetical protein
VSEVRVLGSPGITRFLRYYDPLRGPNQPPPCRRRSVVNRRFRASAAATRHLLDVPCSLPRWIVPVLFGWILRGSPRGLLPETRWPSRTQYPVGIHGSTFRGLLKLHSRYGPSIRSPTLRGLGRKASTPPVTRRHRFSATQAYRNLLWWDFHPLVVLRDQRAHWVRLVLRLVGRHRRQRPAAVRARDTIPAHCVELAELWRHPQFQDRTAVRGDYG